jgi:hypothetical protein
MHTRTLFLLLLAALAVFERVVFDFGPNIELVTTISIVTGMVATKRWRLVAPLAVMALSDFFLGVGLITLFTWSGFLLMPWLASVVNRTTSSSLMAGIASALLSVAWFYLWTNFGVWLTEGYGMYPNTVSGLLASYVAGLPFVRLQLLSALVSVPFALGSLALIERNVRIYSLLPITLTCKKTH